jgi:ribosomal protein S6
MIYIYFFSNLIPHLRKYATSSGQRIVWDARYITATIDASPNALVELNRLLKSDEGILRHFTIKQPSEIQKAKWKDWRNIYAEKETDTK